MFRHWKGLLAAGLAALVGGTACWARFGETSRLVLRREEVALPAAARPFTVALFSDTHLGRYGGAQLLRRVAALIDAQQPDLVVFAGDFFDAYRRDQELLDLDELAAILAGIEAPFGKYAVWGNHDRGGGAHRVYGELMERGGFALLQNQAVALPDLGLVLGGLDDALLGRPDFSLSLEGEGLRVLVAHDPGPAAEQVPGAHLILSGHTHGGQLGLPLVRRLLLPPGSGSYAKGSYPLGEGRFLQVTSGVGVTKVPARLFDPPEVVLLQIVPGQKGSS